jgi:hypothetical protein
MRWALFRQARFYGSGVKLVGKSFVIPGISPELDRGTWRLSGGQNLRSAKLQAPSIKLDKLQAPGYNGIQKEEVT